MTRTIGGRIYGTRQTKQEEHKMVKLIWTQTLWGTTYRKRVSEAEWMDTFKNVYKTPGDAAIARCDVARMGSHKVRYTWYA